uniref:Uncharacterized protein n=1 Tax=Branchiostoma floridae TaxID=7739 RepID=C3XRX2_BRAFL|eukprot:XP_002613431.1 hypothetical protein BRAFLDRAFT_84555 [Branchiostoma floridae]
MKLTTLAVRRFRGDMLEVFKIIKGLEGIDRTTLFTSLQTPYNTRGHHLRLSIPSIKLEIRRRSFARNSKTPFTLSIATHKVKRRKKRQEYVRVYLEALVIVNPTLYIRDMRQLLQDDLALQDADIQIESTGWVNKKRRQRKEKCRRQGKDQPGTTRPKRPFQKDVEMMRQLHPDRETAEDNVPLDRNAPNWRD